MRVEFRAGLWITVAYIDIEFYALKQCADDREYELVYVKIAENRADLFTKSLSCDAPRSLCELVDLV